MKHLISIVLLCVVCTFASDIYRDGTACECDSIHISYRDDGTILAESAYVNGYIDKRVVLYGTNGVKIADWLPLNDINGMNVDRIEKRYDSSGVLINEAIIKNGKKNGVLKTFYPSGLVSSTQPYMNGKINGVTVHYTEDGNIFITATVLNDKLNGVMSTFYPSGQLAQTWNYINDKASGAYKQYFPNGKLAGTATYKNEVIQGYKTCTDGRIGNESLDCTE